MLEASRSGRISYRDSANISGVERNFTFGIENSKLWTLCNNGKAICMFFQQKKAISVMHLPHMSAAR